MATTASERIERTEVPTRVRAAIVAAAGLFVHAAFQLVLALGAPFGRAAYGGSETHLSDGLRIASAVAALVWSFAALVVLRRGGYRVPLMTPKVARIGTWVVACLLALGGVANLASSSGWERFGWGPFTVLLAVLCFVVARAGGAPSEERNGDQGDVDP